MGEDHRLVRGEQGVEFGVRQPVRVLGRRLESHQVDDVDDAHLEIGQMGAEQVGGSERLQRRDIPGAREHHVRRELAVPYPEPEPSPYAVHAQAAARLATAEHAWQRTWKWVGKPSIGLALLLVVLAGCARSVSGNFSLGLTAVTIAALCGPGFAWTGWQWLRREQARDMTPEQEYREAMAGWDQRATDHENAELARLAGQPEWGSATIAPRRTDVFGGTLAGWQALLTVHGASLLASRPLLAIDLTGQHAAAWERNQPPR